MKVVWAPEAADEFDATIAYLAERNPQAARKLAEGVLTLIERLAVEPLGQRVFDLEMLAADPLFAHLAQARSRQRGGAVLGEHLFEGFERGRVETAQVVVEHVDARDAAACGVARKLG